MFDLTTIARKLTRVEAEAREPSASPGPRAAVAALLRERPEGTGADLFFIRRAERQGDPWSGHIAFPGGRHEGSDESLLATAIRETREEVGVDLSSATLLARLPDVPAFTQSKAGVLVVAAFVFAVPSDVPIVQNHEVAESFWLPFASLARGEGRGTYSFTWEGRTYELPCIRFGSEKHVLWGLTYRMLEMMLELTGEAPAPSAAV